MARPKPKRDRTCRGKRRYRDQAEAQAALRGFRNYSQRSKTPCRAYECEACRGWHITARKTWSAA